MPRTDKPTGAMWEVFDAWADRQQKADPFGRRPTQTDMAVAFDVGVSMITHWKQMTSRMQAGDMVNIARRTDITYAELSKALARDEPTLAKNVDLRSQAGPKARGYRKRRRQGGTDVRKDVSA